MRGRVKANVFPEPVGDNRIMFGKLKFAAICCCMAFNDSMPNFAEILLNIADSFITVVICGYKGSVNRKQIDYKGWFSNIKF